MTDSQMLQTIFDGQQAIRDDLKRLEKKIEENMLRLDKLFDKLEEMAIKRRSRQTHNA